MYPDFYGHVYFIKCDNLIKIGITQNTVILRVRSIQSEIKKPVQILTSLYVRDHGTMEATLHKKFAKSRVHGEWFNLDEKLNFFIEETSGKSPSYQQVIDLLKSL